MLNPEGLRANLVIIHLPIPIPVCEGTTGSLDNINLCTILQYSPNTKRVIVFSYLFKQCCIFTGIIPKIVEQPQNQRTVLGDTVTFRCTASTSGPQITFKWMPPPDGRHSEVKAKPASAKLSIKEVTEGDRGKYRCIVKNGFGEEKSQPAELIIGM